jgi:hypothetical protein
VVDEATVVALSCSNEVLRNILPRGDALMSSDAGAADDKPALNDNDSNASPRIDPPSILLLLLLYTILDELSMLLLLLLLLLLFDVSLSCNNDCSGSRGGGVDSVFRRANNAGERPIIERSINFFVTDFKPTETCIAKQNHRQTEQNNRTQ